MNEKRRDQEHAEGCEPLGRTFQIHPTLTYLVENRTPYDIEIECSKRRLVIPALSTRIMAGRRLSCFSEALVQLRQRHQLRVREHLQTPLWVTLVGSLAMLGFIALPAVVIVRFVQDGTLLVPLTGQLLLAAAVPTAIAGITWFAADHHHRERQTAIHQVDGDMSLQSIGLTGSDGDMGLRMFNAGALLVMLVIGVVLPATWLYFGTDLHQAVSFDGGLSIEPQHAAEAAWRSIQITYVAVLVTLPALLYFLFDRIQVSRLQPQWWRDLFRLDSRLHTLADLNAHYGHDLAEAAGHRSGIMRRTGSKRSPIIVATVLFAVGWTLLVLPTKARDVTEEAAASRADVAATAAEAALEIAQNTSDDAVEQAALSEAERAAEAARAFATEATSGALDGEGPEQELPVFPAPLLDAESSIEQRVEAEAESARSAATTAAIVTEEVGGGGTFQIFDPDPSAATAAFLGAYFFSLFVALRGFSRRDLNPKMYVTMAARVAVASSIAFLVVVVTPWGEAAPTIALAFIGGMMPTPVIIALVTAPLQVFRGGGSQPAPDVGQSTARTATPSKPGRLAGFRRLANQVDDSMSDRRPLALIDHVDIFERARLDAEGLGDVEALAHSRIVQLMVATRIPTARLVDWVDQAILVIHLEGPTSDQAPNHRLDELRALGVRTATDLVSVVESNRLRDVAANAPVDELVEIFDSEAKLQTVVKTIRAETNFPYVDGWRTSRFDNPDEELPVLGADGLLRGRPSRWAPGEDRAA